MKALVFNCGSSSLKFELLELDGGSRRQLARGRFEQIGANTQAIMICAGERIEQTTGVRDHAAAALAAVDWLQARRDAAGDTGTLANVAVHRIVHGGGEVIAAAVVDDAVLRVLEAAGRFAPLHNPPALATLRAVSRRLADTPAVVVPDTAFHHTLPEYAREYALPRKLAQRLGIRRFGFHGVGHAWMMERYVALSGRRAAELKLITLQLGAGCSAAAILGGRSVDTSMGLTPLEGLMMATRSGDLDPAIVDFIARTERLTPAQIDQLLNHDSGLLGVSGRSGDMRILESQAAGDETAELAVQMFCYRARKYIGAYLAALGGADAIVFGGGIGENSATVRSRICAGLEPLGIVLDEARNRRVEAGERRISTDSSPVEIYVVPLDEELYMARAAVRLLQPESQ